MNATTKIKNLYKSHPESMEKLSEAICPREMEDLLEKLDVDPPKELTIEYLDNHSDEDLALLIAFLPPNIIKEEFGYEVLYWSWMEYPYGVSYEQYEFLTKQLEKISGKSKDRLEKISIEARANDGKVSTALAIDRLIDYINSKELLESFDLKNRLKEYALPGVEISEKRSKDYSLIPLNTKDGVHGPAGGWWITKVKNKSIEIWLDTPVGVGLTYKEIPNAVLGLTASDALTLMIHQIQGIRPYKLDKNGTRIGGRSSSRGLFPLDWKRLLVECGEQVAKDLDFEWTGMRGYKNNHWVDNDYLPEERAIKIYDETAERLGYEQGRDNNWYKKID